MLYAWLANAVLAVHFLFVLFVIAGGFLVWRWHRVAWLHIPAVIWGAAIEFMGWICPLTPLENYFRVRAGGLGYDGGFIQHYLYPILYPAQLTPQIQWILGTLVVVLNLFVYGWLWARSRR